MVIILFSLQTAYANSPNTAQILEPRLYYLNTNNGLDQDTVNDIHIDDEGFMWVATDEGLNRFDGAKVLKVKGLNNELESIVIYRIFEHSSGLLFLATDRDGVLTLNKQTREIKTLLNTPFKYDSNWVDNASDFIEDSNGNVIIALHQSIHKLNWQSQSINEIYSQSKADYAKSKYIQTLFLFKNKLFFGTNYGLNVLEENSNNVVSIYGNEDTEQNIANVKVLTKINDNELLMGTVNGLYKFPLGEILNFIESTWELPAPITVISERHIWDIERVSGEIAYVGTDIGLFSLNLKTLRYQYLFQPRRGYEELSALDVKDVELDKNNNVWFGTLRNGAMLWSPDSLSFSNFYNTMFTEKNKRLSSNVVWSIFQYDPNTLFVGTVNGINQVNLQTQEIIQHHVNQRNKAANTDSDIRNIDSTERGFLWVNTGAGVKYFSIAEQSYIEPPIRSQAALNLLSEYAYSIYLEGQERIWIITIDSVKVIERKTETITDVNPIQYGLALPHIYKFLGIDVRTNSMLLSASGQLWGINLDNFEMTLLHSVKHENIDSTIHPSEFVRGFNNRAWLAYSSHALYKLDGNTLLTLESYSTQNVLPTNVIYDLNMDRDGNLWFSSHSGIHSFNTKEKSTKSFGLLNGLASSEFNQYAGELLSDGRFAYGGNLGFTLFQPEPLINSYLKNTQKVVLTEVHLSSRKLNLPLVNLNDSIINLENNDVGLSLNFSSLGYDVTANTRFNYRITTGRDVINYPSINTTKLSLPMLDPGEHIIEIFNMADTKRENSARLYVNVKYPLLASPLAYFVYFLLFIVIGFTVYSRRRKVQQIVDSANLQVQLYNKRLTEALIASNANIWEWDSENNLLCSERIRKDLFADRKSECMLFDDFVECIHINDRPTYLSTWRAFLNKEEATFDLSYRMYASDGTVCWYRDVGSLNETENGKVEVKGTYTNITQEIAAQEKLKLFGNAFKHTRDWVLIFNNDKRLIATNPSFRKAVGMNEFSDMEDNAEALFAKYQDLLKSTVSRLNNMHPKERYKTETHLRIQDKELTLLTDINAVADEKYPDLIDFYLIIATDITEQMSAQKELQKLANYDILTGLNNRSLLLEKLKQSIHFSHRHNSKLAALFIDLDRFKPINDSFGHLAGDTVLSEVANRISSHFSEEDVVARIGGDEFVVVLEEVLDIHDVNVAVSNLLKAIELPISIGKQNVSVSASIGIAIYPNDATDAEHLIRNADIAMYSAKEAGKNRYQHFTQTMNDKVQNNTILQNRVIVASANKEFENYYQAIVDIKSGESAGFEMLMRWSDEGKFISPADFIPIAEQVGCIIEMTMNAIQQAIFDISIWYKEGFKGYVAINLSARQFSKRPDFESILRWLKENELPTSCLRFEITEGLLIDTNENTLDYMHEMRKLGFKIALDDFGTGYSSLKYIKDFPIDVLKIDRSFVNDMIADKGTESIVQSTLILTRLLGLDTVAEGVENYQELIYFQQNNCKYVQGFYFAKPMPAVQARSLLFKDWLKNEGNIGASSKVNDKIVKLVDSSK